MKIVFKAVGDLVLQGPSDADWSGDTSDKKLTTGHFYKLNDNGGTFCWNCRKQNTVAWFSCGADYQGMCAAVPEKIFQRQLMQDSTITQVEATPVAADYQNSFKLCNNPVFNKWSKHMSTKFRYIREKVEDGNVEMFYQPTQEMAADISTKTVRRLKFDKHRDYLLGNDTDLSNEKATGKIWVGVLRSRPKRNQN